MASDSWLEQELAELDEAEKFIQQTMSNFIPSKSASKAAEQSSPSVATKTQVTNQKGDTDIDKLTNQLIHGLAIGKPKESYESFNLPPPPDLDELIVSEKENKAPKSPDLPPPPPALNTPPPPAQTKPDAMSKTAPPPVLPKPSRSTSLKSPQTGVGNITIKLDRPSKAPPAAAYIPPPVKDPPSVYTMAEDVAAPPKPPPPTGAGIPKNVEKNSAEELDFLTNNLLSNMDNPSEKDLYGYCEKCNMVVEGEKVGCNALDSVYHIKCFTCATCSLELHGEPFYAVEKKPFCETCYVASLDKCTVCSQTITDRILRATGKPFHPSCFKCSECGKSLDGIPFTVDEANKIYCVEDYHQKYAPRCSVCQLPILPEPGKEETVRIIALDRSFHVQCYRCEKCQVQLSSDQGCYPLDNHIFCRECNTVMVQQITA